MLRPLLVSFVFDKIPKEASQNYFGSNGCTSDEEPSSLTPYTIPSQENLVYNRLECKGFTIG